MRLDASLSALAAVEARRLITHPLVLAGLAISVVAIVAGAESDGQGQSFLLMGLVVMPLALATFATANFAALRSDASGASELLGTLPRGVNTRTAAQLLAVLAAVPLAVALVAAAHLAFGAGGGLVVGADGERHTPALVELAQGPMVVVALGAVGVLLGRVAPVAVLGALLVVAIIFLEVPLASWMPDTPWRWVVPVANNAIAVPDTWLPCEPMSRSMCSQVERYDTGAMAWHLVGLAGIAVAASAAALTGRRAVRLTVAVACVALVATTSLVAG